MRTAAPLVVIACSTVSGFGSLSTLERLQNVARRLGGADGEAADATSVAPAAVAESPSPPPPSPAAASSSSPAAASSSYADCIDRGKECKRWAQSGECANNPQFMLQECRASCQECESEHCHDKQAGCASWAQSGECGQNHKYMLAECPYSCGVCDVNFKEGCRRDPKMQPAAVPGTIDATFRRAMSTFGHLKPRVIHREPWILSFDEFLQPWEADHLVKTAGHNFERSLAGDGVTPVRTSTTSWCNVVPCLQDAKFQEVRERIVNVTRVPWANAEHLQVLRYQPGQFYREHHDQNSPVFSAWGPRLFTFFMYLSDVELGGATRFTKLNISVVPRKGSAILWPSVRSDDPWTIEEGTHHEAVTVDKGIKYAANFWIHMASGAPRIDSSRMRAHERPADRGACAAAVVRVSSSSKTLSSRAATTKTTSKTACSTPPSL